jgi:5,5'-dehydrodivanillate O-demethylase oxygenase subunit
MTLIEQPSPSLELISQPPSAELDIATTRPGTPGGVFMRQFWHAIHRSQDLPAGHAKPIRIMSEDYTLYRGHSGTAQIIAHRCPHRGAPMHLGWVEDDDIRCVYHGWKFACSGRCIEQPAEEPGFARKVSIRTYPTREYLGLVFGYFGPGEPPPFPHFPHRMTEGLVQVWNAEEVPCNYLQSFENSMDEVHVAFTHQPGGSHAKLAVDLPLISAEETDWGMLRLGTQKSGKVRQTLHYAPNITRVIVPPLAGMDGVSGWTEIYFSFAPVDDENHLWLITSHVEVTGVNADAYRAKRADYDRKVALAPPVMEVVRDIWSGERRYADVTHPDLAIVQDIAVQAGQGRIEDRASERLGRSDAAIILWRKILARELRAFAEGRAPKRWKTPPADVVPTLGF